MEFSSQSNIRSSFTPIRKNLEVLFVYYRDERRLRCVWRPQIPSGHLNGKALERYETALGLFMQHCADTLDESVVVVDGELMRVASPSDDYEVTH